MAEKIFTIPINEAFDASNGCPLCRLLAGLEENSLSYVMGAAMMDPDVRLRTNELGFCARHFAAMRAQGNRLSLALLLESHLNDVGALFSDPPSPSRFGRLKKYDGESLAAPIARQAGTCYVCARVASFESQYCSNVVYLWKKDPSFREKLQKQPFFCLEHAGKLLETGQKELSEAQYLEFAKDLYSVMAAQCAALKADVTAFCRSFDHENAGKPLSEAQRTAVERSIAFLAGEDGK